MLSLCTPLGITWFGCYNNKVKSAYNSIQTTRTVIMDKICLFYIFNDTADMILSPVLRKCDILQYFITGTSSKYCSLQKELSKHFMLELHQS